jgi:plasmid stability protein
MATLTVKNIPQKVFERLKRRAKTNRRSLNQEVIAVIEQALEVPHIDVASTMERTQKILQNFPETTIELGLLAGSP